jgi:hypothetical protein
MTDEKLAAISAVLSKIIAVAPALTAIAILIADGAE